MGRYKPKVDAKKEPKETDRAPSELTVNQFRALRHLLLHDIPDFVVQTLQAMDCCMSLSWMVSEALNAYGVKCKPMRVKCTFVNQYGLDYLRKHGVQEFWKEHQRTRNDAKKEIWTVGLGYEVKGEEDPLHAVVVFEGGSVLDMTADQASRPNHEMVVKRYWATDKLPPNILDFQFTKVKTTSGSVVNRPDFKPIFDYVLKRIGETLGKEPKVIKWISKEEFNEMAKKD